MLKCAWKALYGAVVSSCYCHEDWNEVATFVPRAVYLRRFFLAARTGPPCRWRASLNPGEPDGHDGIKLVGSVTCATRIYDAEQWRACI